MFHVKQWEGCPQWPKRKSTKKDTKENDEPRRDTNRLFEDQADPELRDLRVMQR